MCTDVLRHSDNTLRVCVAVAPSTLFSHFSPYHPFTLFIYSFGGIELLLISRDQRRGKEKKKNRKLEKKRENPPAQNYEVKCLLQKRNTNSMTLSTGSNKHAIRNLKL